MRSRLWLLALLLLAAPALWAGPFDWPQWRGARRDGHSAETGLLKDWPKKGPSLAWKATGLGDGYAGVSVADGRIFTMGERRLDPSKPKGPVETLVLALDEATGKELWAIRIGERHGDGGPRSTPTVDGDRVYALAPHGEMLCLEAATGKTVWGKNLRKDFDGQVGGWAYCESLLIDGDRLVCTPGGSKATLAALDKKTGETLWKARVPGGDRAEYSSVIIADVGGQKQYVQFLGGGVVGVKADDGEYLWRYDHPANGTANCSTPVYHDGCVFAASAYGNGGGLARLKRDGDKTTAEEVYFVKDMQNHHGGMVLVDGYLYGEGGGRLTCLDFKTGEVMWREGRPGKGSIAYADGRLYYRNEGGPIYLVEANPKKYVEHGRFETPPGGRGPAWPHPVLANGKLYIRHADVLFCYDVKQP